MFLAVSSSFSVVPDSIVTVSRSRTVSGMILFELGFFDAGNRFYMIAVRSD
jgi:hypothetical protein